MNGRKKNMEKWSWRETNNLKYHQKYEQHGEEI